MSRKDSNASCSSSKKPRHSAPKSSSCDGLAMTDARFEKLCASNGISVHLTHYVRSRNIGLNSPVSRFLNWSSCPTSVADRLTPRSRVCGCRDSTGLVRFTEQRVVQENPPLGNGRLQWND